MKKNKTYEESRIIRKAVNDGKNINEIMEMLSLSKNQIKYRIQTQYSKKIALCILNKLNMNNATIQERKTRISKKSLVVDTSSLGKSGSFEFIMRHSSIILILDIVYELEKHKTSNGILGRNVRHLLSESARDKKGEKIKVELAEKISEYTDDNLINFCKDKDVILYTADNAMATKARAYNIEYIIAEDMVEKQYEVKDDSVSINKQEVVLKGKASEEALPKGKKEEADIIDVDIDNLAKNMQASSISSENVYNLRANISNVSLMGGNLFLTIPRTTKIAYIVLSNEKVKMPIVDNNIKLEIGDIVLVMTYKIVHNGLCVSR